MIEQILTLQRYYSGCW